MTPLVSLRSDARTLETSIATQLDALTKSDRFYGTGLVGPGYPITLHVRAKFPQTDIDRFRAKTLAILVFGRVTYADLFSGNKVTKFCFVAQHNDPRLIPCEFHNSAN